MKTWLRPSLLLVIGSFLLSFPAMAEPFAPTATIPKSYKNDYYKAVVKKLAKEMPSKETLPAPLCPSCVASQMWAGMQGVEGVLDNIMVLSPEPPEKVVEFYRAQLPDWKQTKEHDFQWVFWKGAAMEKNPSMPKVPHVVIYATSADSVDQELFSKMKTHITLSYDSKAKAKSEKPATPKVREQVEEE